VETLPEPPPPAGLPELRTGDVRTIRGGTLIWRIYDRGGVHPSRWDQFRSWGPHSAGRFDHHPPPPRDHPDRSIQYATSRATPRHRGADPDDGAPDLTCIAERFQETRVIDSQAGQPWLAAFRAARDVRLLNPSSPWASRAGCGALLAAGPRRTARAWSRSIHQRYRDVDGLIWPSSVWPSGDAIALYERAQDACPPHPALHIPLSDPDYRQRLETVANRLGYHLL
jgi:hypothetical protein